MNAGRHSSNPDRACVSCRPTGFESAPCLRLHGTATVRYAASLRALLIVSLLAAVRVDATARPVALIGGRLIDGFGGPPLANSVILIDDERITAVGSVGTLEIPPDAEVISTEGMSVLPGLWDCHVHTMLLGHSDYDHWDKAYIDRFGSRSCRRPHINC